MKNYFIVADFSYLATVNTQANLGAEIRSTTYFVVEAPDIVGNHSGNIGLPPIGETNGTYVSNIKEYPDFVVLKATDVASTGDFLQQATTAQAVLRFSLQTDQARALFQSVTLTRTGTSADSDVTRVNLWYDTHGTGIFDPATDVVLGTGTFGNPAAGLAKIVLDTTSYSTDLNDLTTGPLKIDTAVRKLNTYFLTYDMSNIANPQTTLGVSVSSAVYVIVSAPNIMMSTGMPGGFAAAHDHSQAPGPARRQGILVLQRFGQLPAAVPLGARAAGGHHDHRQHDGRSAAVGHYGAGRGSLPVWRHHAPNVLTNVNRCLIGCDPAAPPAHSTFTFVNNVMENNYLGMNYTQGTRNAAFMKLTLQVEDSFNVRWFSLDLGRVVPPGLKGADGDFAALKVYDGATYVRSAAGDVSLGNTLMGSGVSNFGVAHITLNDPNIGSPGYVLVSTNARTFWVAADINQSATAGHVFGLSGLTKDAFRIGALIPGDGIHSVDPVNFPIQTGANSIGATVDTMTVTYADLLPTTIQQAATNVPVARLNLKVNQNTVIWQGLNLQRTGPNPDDGDILRINVWKDINDNGIFDTGNPEPVSPLSADISAGDIALTVQVSSSFPASGVVLIGHELIKYTTNDNVNTLGNLTRGFLGTPAAVHALNTPVHAVTNDTVLDDFATRPGQITSGTDNFTGNTKVLTFVTPQIIPNTTDKFTGVNYFVSYDINPFAPVYRDQNNNGSQDPGEAVGIGALIPNATSFLVLAPDLVSLASTPPLATQIAAITEYPDLVTFAPDTTVTPVYATQGDKDVPILKFSLKTGVSTALINAHDDLSAKAPARSRRKDPMTISGL